MSIVMSHEGVSENGVVYLRNRNASLERYDKPRQTHFNIFNYDVISLNEEPQIIQLLVVCTWEIKTFFKASILRDPDTVRIITNAQLP